jgi:hypothetical protein
MSLMNGVF